ncbi:MAG: HEAT repeat domain-containing protein [Pseudomonadota bacterium]
MRQKHRPNATADTIGLLVTLLLLPTDGLAQHWDLQPSPIQKIEAAGFTPSVETVIAVLNDRNNPELRPIAARALAQLHDTQPTDADEASFAALVAAISDDDLAVRVYAIQALGFFRRPESIQVLTEAFDHESDAHLQYVIVGGLYKLRMPENVSKFQEIALNKAIGSKTRRMALAGTEDVGAQGDFAALGPVLDDRDPEVRSLAALIMARKKAIEIDRLVEIAMDDDVAALGGVGLIEQIESIVGEQITDSSSFATHENRVRQLRVWWEKRTAASQ